MNAASAVIRVSFRVALPAVSAFEDALEPFCDAQSWLESKDGCFAEVQGYAADGFDEEALRTAIAGVAEAAGVVVSDMVIGPVEDRDWVAETQKAFPPVSIGRFFIHGDHVTDPPPFSSLPLCIGAGAAFGTGEHESTAGCLDALERLARTTAPGYVLDMGCGTGILALAAAQLWPGADIRGVDVDPRAVQVAHENAAINGLDGNVGFAVSDGYRGRAVRVGAPYDLIIANILARPLKVMAPALARHLAPGGRAVLAGFLGRDAGRVLAAHRAQGLFLVRRIPVGAWTTLIVGKR